MTIAMRAAVALLAATAAAPALAQYGGSYDPQPKPRRAPAPEPQATAGQVKPSKQAHKAILELQAAVTANDAAAIAEKAAAAQALATSKEDHYLIAQLQLKAALARKDLAAAGKALGEVRASGFLPVPAVAQLYRGLGTNAYNAKQYDQAASMFEAAMAMEPQNLEAVTLLAETRISQGRREEGLALLQRLIQARLAAGQKPEENVYKRAVQTAYDAKLPAATDLARQWLAAYPSKESWRNSIAIYRNMARPDLVDTLALMRLMRAAGALTVPSDVSLYVTVLSDQNNFIEAQTALDQVLAAGVADAEVKRLAATLQAKPRTTAAEVAAAAKTAQSGNALMRIGDRFYGLGEYAKAVELYRQAMGKPGVDNNVANLSVGMALAASGDKAGATSALNAVTGPHSGAAKYWLLYLQSRG